jgi:hypothetical protein
MLFVSNFSILIAIPNTIYWGIGVGIGISIAFGIDFLLLNPVQLEWLIKSPHC